MTRSISRSDACGHRGNIVRKLAGNIAAMCCGIASSTRTLLLAALLLCAGTGMAATYTINDDGTEVELNLTEYYNDEYGYYCVYLVGSDGEKVSLSDCSFSVYTNSSWSSATDYGNNYSGYGYSWYDNTLYLDNNSNYSSNKSDALYLKITSSATGAFSGATAYLFYSASEFYSWDSGVDIVGVSGYEITTDGSTMSVSSITGELGKYGTTAPANTKQQINKTIELTSNATSLEIDASAYYVNATNLYAYVWCADANGNVVSLNVWNSVTANSSSISAYNQYNNGGNYSLNDNYIVWNSPVTYGAAAYLTYTFSYTTFPSDVKYVYVKSFYSNSAPSTFTEQEYLTEITYTIVTEDDDPTPADRNVDTSSETFTVPSAAETWVVEFPSENVTGYDTSSVKYLTVGLWDNTAREYVAVSGTLEETNSSHLSEKRTMLLWNCSDSETTAPTSIPLRVTKPDADTSWDNYEVRFYWSETAATTNENGWVTEEPTLTGGHIISFNQYDDPTLADTSSLNTSSDTVPIPNFGFTEWNVTLPVANAYYVRLQLWNKTEGAAVKLASGTLTSAAHSDFTTYTSASIWWSASNTTYGSNLTVTVSLPDGASWDDYEVRAYWSTSGVGNDCLISNDGKTYLYQEPTLTGGHIISFELYDDPTPTEQEKNENYKETNGKQELDSSSTSTCTIDLLSSIENASDIVYLRWQLLDSEGNAVSIPSTAFSSAGNYRLYDKAYVWYDDSKIATTDALSTTTDALSVTYTKAGVWWDTYTVVVYYATDLTGLQLVTDTSGNTYVSKEPTTLAGQHTLTFTEADSNRNCKFVHYEGYGNKAFNDIPEAYGGFIDNGYGKQVQATHVWEYDYYVSSADEELNLLLPLEDFTKNGHEALEPLGYYRWYNYATDEASTHLTVHSSDSTMLKQVGDAGLIAWKINSTNNNYPCQGTVGVSYRNANYSDDWEGETIACDVSRYIDDPYNPETGNFCNLSRDDNGFYTSDGTSCFGEPTISIRYLFNIRPAKWLAEQIMAAAVASDDETADHTYEDKRRVVVGLKDNNATCSPRLTMQQVSRYWFYELTNGWSNGHPSGRHIYNNDSKYDISESDFDTSELYQAQKVAFVAYNSDKTMCSALSIQTARHFDLSMSTFAQWYNLDGNTATGPSINYGDILYIVAYLFDESGTHCCPVANWEVKFKNTHPMTEEEIKEKGHYERLPDYWKEHGYEEKIRSNFDADNPTQTLDVPTDPYDNQDACPSWWDRRSYAFSYENLFKGKYSWGYNNEVVYGQFTNPGHGCIHGEYGIYKTANVSGISGTNNEYNWYITTEVHDRTWHDTNGSSHGYFLYVDAADEARDIATREFSANLCTGSTLYFSVWVCSLTSASTKPAIDFEVFGVVKDEYNTVTEQARIVSFNSGDFSNNVNSLADGTWYQVYGSVVLTSDMGVERFSDYILKVCNRCTNTNGADFCIDEINVYCDNTRIECIQSGPLCSGSDYTTTDEDGTERLVANSGVTFKLRGLHETLVNQTSPTESNPTTVQFHFCTEDGEALTGINYYYNSSDTNLTGLDYGEAKIFATSVFDTTKTFKDLYGEGYNLADAEKYVFETDDDGMEYIVLANRFFNLPVGETIYISVRIVYEDGEYGEWGMPTQICSIYSSSFKVTQQDVTLTDGNDTEVSTLTVDCEEGDTYNSYSLYVRTTITGNTGAVDVPLDYYILKASEEVASEEAAIQAFQNESYNNTKLAVALSDFRETTEAAATYSNVSSNSTSGSYTEDDKTCLLQYVYNPEDNGDSADKALVLAASSTFGGEAFPALEVDATYYIVAIPTSDTYTSGDTEYMLCTDPMAFTLTIKRGGPSISLGFEDVSYTEDTYCRTLRLGLPQLARLEAQQQDSNGKGYIEMPLYGIEYIEENKEQVIRFLDADGGESTSAIYLIGTNDPTFLGKDGAVKITSAIAEFKNSTLGKWSNLQQDDDNNKTLAFRFLPLDDNKNASEYLHEGYWYELMFTYEEEVADVSAGDVSTEDNSTEGGITRCTGETYLRVDVVPEYLTWNAVGGTRLNGNWNHDDNWIRSTGSQIYKTDYTEYDGTNQLLRQNAYVPMKFSKVTIMAQNQSVYPYLYYIVYRANGIAMSMANKNSDAATEGIEEAIMVKWTGSVGDGTDNGMTSDGNYRCEKFEGNVCDQVYLKPLAALRGQQYLRYNKAWVEKELEPNKWYGMSTPLQDVYAGDMYVPYNSDGQQTTEAFQPITFTTTGSDIYGSTGDKASYSRLLYPIYQRSWDKAGVKQVELKGSYSAYDKLKGNDGDTSSPFDNGDSSSATSLSSVYWSHVYNDVSQSYTSTTPATETGMYGYPVRSTTTGFSIKAGDSYYPDPQTTNKNAIIRLPKADKKYSYYNYADESVNSLSSNTLNKDSTYRFLVPYNNSTSSGNLAYVSVPLTGVNSQGSQYYLLGNPYAATVSAYSFLNGNSNVLESSKLWKMVGGKLTGFQIDANNSNDTTRMIRPSEAFFVKVKEGVSDSTVYFTTTMTTDYYYNLAITTAVAETAESSAPAIKLMAGSDGDGQRGAGQATILVSASYSDDFADSEDVELLWSETTAESPQVYTVASTQAVEQNRLAEIDWLPLGIVSPEDGEVTLRIITDESLDVGGEGLYLYDAATGTCTEIEESDQSFAIVANEHGRYYLSTTAMTRGTEEGGLTTDNAVRCYSPAPGLLTVSAPTDIIERIQVYGVGGQMVDQLTSGPVQSHTFNVARNIYIVNILLQGQTAPCVKKLHVN